MELCEYQVKRLLKEYKLPVLSGAVAYTPQEAEAIFEKYQFQNAVVRSQMPLNLTASLDEDALCIEADTKEKTHEATAILLDRIYPVFKGIKPYRVYVEEKIEKARSYALSVRIDTKKQKIVFSVQKNNQLKEVELNRSKPTMLFWYSLLRLFAMDVSYHKELLRLFQNMYRVFEEFHALAVELNPLVITKDKRLVVENARIVFDDEALFRLPQITSLKEVPQGMQRQALASQYNFRYIPFKGNIACLVNGSGLGWASIDLILAQGGKPACLLDVGTEPSKEAVSQALKLALSEPEVEGVFINIFGGITRCDTIADGLINASQEISLAMPLVVRMDGTNAQVGNRLLFDSRLPFVVVKDLKEAADLIIQKVEAMG